MISQYSLPTIARANHEVYGELSAPQPDIGEKQHRLAALVFRLNLSREGRKREGIAAGSVNILEKHSHRRIISKLICSLTISAMNYQLIWRNIVHPEAFKTGPA